ncbi:MAG TPA: enoyl-CoA hydratase/isomerase family protein [Steroidobacteraceae bacterium]|nr:enoyl-CoA hydratase/isomerase family protein [Steroidobacteraceae bacterium]
MPGIEYEAHAPIFGDPLIVVDLALQSPPVRRPPGSILVGVDEAGRLPEFTDEFDLLLSADADAPRPWCPVDRGMAAGGLATIQRVVKRNPLAAATLSQVLRIGAHLGVAEALAVESLAYSSLLGGSEFRTWRQSHQQVRALRANCAPREPAERIRFRSEEARVCLELADPERHNAIDSYMRDALCEALNAVLDDPTAPELHLRAQGRAFSVGGDLEEFGTSLDCAAAHAIRTLRSPALLLSRIRERATAFVQGACIGSGIEIAAAAGRIVAAPDSWFSLPEVTMGLIPGAGGTVTIARRIGRQRTLYWALTNRKLNAMLASQWGLVDEVRHAPRSAGA